MADTQSSDAEIYDEVTDEQYRSIVGDRLENDDFIEDDDGSGYVDHGEDEWGGHESSEDEDDFEGEDEELRKGKLHINDSPADDQLAKLSERVRVRRLRKPELVFRRRQSRGRA